MNEEARRELFRLYGLRGALKASEVVDAARDVLSPLHDQFEWDDGAAASEYRLIQSRKLIRRLIVTIEDVEQPAFVHVRTITDDDEGEYRRIDTLEDDEWARAQTDARKWLESAQESVNMLTAAAIRNGKAPEVMAALAIAAEALQAANSALSKVH